MGLDSYLFKRDKRNGKEEVEEIMYWRKANAVHKYFAEKIADKPDTNVEEIHVNKAILEELVDLCKQVLEDPSKAPELLPTGSGLFFGDTTFGDNYFYKLEMTVDGLEPIIKDYVEDIDVEYFYYCWW